MRHKLATFAAAGSLVLVAACGRRNPIRPEADDRSTLRAAHTFVITSMADRRLPAPGAEAATEDAGLDALPAPAGHIERELAGRRPGKRLPDPGQNPVVAWNRLTTALGLAAKLPPPMFAHDYALVQVAIHDALVAAYDPRRDKLPDRVVAAGAASRVLAYLFPGDAGPIQTLAEAELTLVSAPAGHVRRAWGLGRSVGRLAVEHGTRDGSDAVFTGTPPSGEGIWTGTNPLLPMCGTWKTWLITSGSEFAPEPPYAFGSPQDLRDMQEVYEISLHRTPEQIAIVHKWADLPPPTIWNGVLNDRILGSGMSAREAARASAFLNATMTDAFIECWACKYKFWIARPFQRIPGLVTVIPTPNFPSYTSGHSSISAAAAAVMGELFPAEKRDFEAMAQEAALSRLWGGIHFRHDNDQGLAVGANIGELAVEVMRGRPALQVVAAR